MGVDGGGDECHSGVTALCDELPFGGARAGIGFFLGEHLHRFRLC